MTLSITQLILGVLGVLAVPTLGYLGVRFTSGQARRANKEDRDAIWNAGYRAAAEEHLQYDADRIGDIRQLRDLVNRLEAAANLPQTTFQPLPKAPALFPKLEVGT